jgi:hypothetical protein
MCGFKADVSHSKIKLLQNFSGCFIVSPCNMIRQGEFDFINCPMGQIVCCSLWVFAAVV